MADATPGRAAVTDHRTAPRGVLPRGTQTWLMAGLALGIVAIIVLTGRPQAPPRSAPAAVTPPQLTISADRAREYQDRLRALDEHARQQELRSAMSRPPSAAPEYSERPPAPAPDPIGADKKRRDYESLFASNVVVSRRLGGQGLAAGAENRPLRSDAAALPAPPSIDQVADAVVRATTRYTGGTITPPAPSAPLPGVRTEVPERPHVSSRAVASGPIAADDGRLHRIVEGTVIDTVLTNRLDGAAAAPVNCLVTNAIYSHDGQHVLIPAGSRVLGQTKPVQAFGETRLAVTFDRLLLPDGSAYLLDHFTGLNDIGDAGLRDQVNQHYRSTFGAASAIGLITGFAQYVGVSTFGHSSAPTVIVAGSMTESTAQATSQTMNRFLNRLPTITIREGHRVKVYLTNDLELPAYGERSPLASQPLVAQLPEGSVR